MKHISWNIDATNIKLNDLDVSKLNDIVVFTRAIKEYLDVSDDNKKLFIVGPKGLGKTLILKLKSQMLRDKYDGYKFIPKDRLLEKFSKIGFTLSREDLNKFESRDLWDRVWELSLLCLILRRFKIEIPDEIAQYIGYATDLSEILTAILQNRGALDKLYKYVNTHLKPFVRMLPDSGINQVAIFIDNIDEGFEQHVGYSLSYSENSNVNLSQKVWINAQNSIVQIARNLCNSFKHLKIFISIRSEAYINNVDSTKLQLDDYSTILSYTKEEIKQIFIQNINQTSPEYLCKGRSGLAMLTGYDTVEHRFIEDSNGAKVEEDLFSFIYRHTYARPREIVEMGKEIISLLEPGERSFEDVHRVVNLVAQKLFVQLKNEIVPYFRDSIFSEFCKRVKKNIITIEAAQKISKDIEHKFGFSDVFSYFYRLGLIGVVYVDHDSKMRQKFLPVGQYTLSNLPIPEYKYFVIHPTLNEEMKNYHQYGFHDSTNIIGYDRPFKIAEQKSQIKHLHFGLDRDSLSIVISELNKSKCLAIFQEPVHEWSDFRRFEKAKIKFKKTEEIIKFNVYHEGLSKDKKERVLNRFVGDGHPVILYTSDVKVIERILVDVKTISFTRYPKRFFDIISEPSLVKEKFIYSISRVFDNRQHNEINKSLNRLEAKCIPVLVDRFLLVKSVIARERDLMIVLGVENHGTFICPIRDKSTMHPSRIVVRTKNSYEFNYYKLRQNYLVEGVYQFYKYLKQNQELDIGHKEIPDRIFSIFFNIQALRIQIQNKGDAFRRMFPNKSENEIFVGLVNYGKLTYQRIGQLSKRYTYMGSIAKLNKLKSSGIFPSKKDFYRVLSKSKFLNDYEELVRLKEILNISSLEKDFYSVFISYSFVDSVFANLLANFLIINGVKVFLFQMEDPHKELKSIMAEEIENHDKVLFIASQNSLKSKGCQFELSRCRAKRNVDWQMNLISIRIDDYVLNVEERDIPGEFKAEYWKNIQLVKKNNIADYSDYVTNPNLDDFQNKKIKKLIEESLRREVN